MFGHIYVIGNSRLGENVYKVGFTMENIIRLDDINKKGYAGLYGGYYFIYKRQCKKPHLCEQILFKIFADNRLSRNLELFHVDQQMLIDKLDFVCTAINNDDVDKLNIYSLYNVQEKKVRVQKKNDFKKNITLELDSGCFFVAIKIDTTVVHVSNKKFHIKTNSWVESYGAIKNILNEYGFGINNRENYKVKLLKQEVYLIDRKYMMRQDAEVTKLRAEESSFMNIKRKCFEVNDIMKFSFIPELQDECILELVVH